jgi:hypothetical protein
LQAHSSQRGTVRAVGAHTPSLTYERLAADAGRALGDRRRLKDLRRRIRRDPTVSDAERTELMERARYVPGCIPPVLELGDDGEVRPVEFVDAQPTG